MGKLFDYDNKAMQLLNKVSDMVIISILWLALSLTIIGFGPACAAAYYTTAKCVRHERGNVFQEFWSALKSNFVQSALLGLLLLFFAASLFLFDFAEIANAILNHQNMQIKNMILSSVKFFVFFALILYLFPIQSRFQAKLVRVVISSILLMFRYIGYTIIMVVVLLAAIITCIIYPYLSIVMPGIVLYLISFPMERILLRLVAEEDLEKDNGKDQWYLEKSKD